MYSYDFASLMGSMVYLIIYGALMLVPYVFRGIGLMTIMRNRGHNNIWMAWVPVVATVAVGKLGDEVQERRGKKTHYARTLIWSGILFVLSYAAFIILMIGFIFAIDNNDENAGIILFLLFLGAALLMLVCGVVYAIFEYIAYYRLIYDYKPDMAMVIVLISAFVFRICDIYLFAIRNNTPVQQVYYQGAYYANTSPHTPYQSSGGFYGQQQGYYTPPQPPAGGYYGQPQGYPPPQPPAGNVAGQQGYAAPGSPAGNTYGQQGGAKPAPTPGGYEQSGMQSSASKPESLDKLEPSFPDEAYPPYDQDAAPPWKSGSSGGDGMDQGQDVNPHS